MKYQKSFQESRGLVLRKFLCIVWFLLPLLLSIPLTVVGVTGEIFQKKPLPVEIVSLEIQDLYSFEGSNYSYSNAQLAITFNEEVVNGSVMHIIVYDSNDNILLEKDVACYAPYGEDTVTLFTPVYIQNGKIDHFEVVDFSEVSPVVHKPATSVVWRILPFVGIWALARALIAVPCLIFCLCLSCKSYSCNNHEILVFAGRLQHYIKVDGVKIDQKSALFSLSPFALQATTAEGDRIEASISSLTKRINLKINGMLQNPQ